MRELGLNVRGFRLRQSAAPLAVLIGPNTASSGESVAIAFAGRAFTRSFGQRSAGYTSANLTTALSDGAVLGVPSAWGADRTGREYRAALTPDEAVPEGEELKAARDWLDDHCATRPL
jgi:carboxyl-terminal processing protease